MLQSHYNIGSGILKESEESIMSEENKDLKVVLVPVGGRPRIQIIKNTLPDQQAIVGGYIEVLAFEKNMLLICNEEGKLKRLPGNRRVGKDIIVGDFFITSSDDEGEFISLSDEQISYALECFDAVEDYTPENVEQTAFMNFLSFDDDDIDGMIDQIAARRSRRDENNK
jgi:hypothetical protein